MEIRNVLTVAYFVLSIYMYGGGVMSTLVYYESWKLVGEEEFAAVHSSVTSRMLPRFGFVLALLVLVNTSLIWLHNPAISTWLIVLTAAIHLLMVVIRFAVFVPIHKKLDKAKSIELIDMLLKYDIYMGSGIPASIKMIATIVMLYQVVSASPVEAVQPDGRRIRTSAPHCILGRMFDKGDVDGGSGEQGTSENCDELRDLPHCFPERGYAASAPTLQYAPSESTNCASTQPKSCFLGGMLNCTPLALISR